MFDTERLSKTQKEANDFAWYKKRADSLETRHDSHIYGTQFNTGYSEYQRMKVNYNMFNNILDTKELEYVCKPFGDSLGELPAKMVNRDITSGKIKTVVGMESKRPLNLKVIAVNEEASTEREKVEFDKIKEFVTSSIMNPIREKVELKYQEQNKGRELTEEEKAQVQQQIASEMEAMTPDKVKQYMKRDYQNPAEILNNQLLNYLVKKTDFKNKSSKAFKHMLLSAYDLFYVGEVGDEPQCWALNPKRFSHDVVQDVDYIEDGEWATYEYRMLPSQVIKFFGKDLSNTEIDKIYNDFAVGRNKSEEEMLFDFSETYADDDTNHTIKVLHSVWKGLKQIGILEYEDPDSEEPLMTVVNENYKIQKEYGDIKITWYWIPQVYETWKIGKDIYKNMQPIVGQNNDPEDLYNVKLPYYGAVCDNTNSIPTALYDRLRDIQYYYDIILYKIELLVASDEGKKVLMNINAIPDSAGIDMEKWQYFFKSSPFMWYDPNQEGVEYNDVNSMAKVIDLSLVSDISKYIEFAEYLRDMVGKSTGITQTVEGQTEAREGVRNVQQNLTQSAYILEPYFKLHEQVKRNTLDALLKTAKIVYARTKPKFLSYILDDMSVEVIKMDVGLLENNRVGLFLEDNTKNEDIKKNIENISMALFQNDKLEASTLLKLLKNDSLNETQEILEVAEDKRDAKQAQIQAQENENIKEQMKLKDQLDDKASKRKMAEDVNKEEERRKTEIIKASLVGASFNPDQDKDNDGVNDFIEIAEKQLKGDLAVRKQLLEEKKFDETTKTNKKKLELEEKKISQKNKTK